MIQFTSEKWDDLKSQIMTSRSRGIRTHQIGSSQNHLKVHQIYDEILSKVWKNEEDWI